MITSYDLGKIYEFSNDQKFVNRTIGVLVSYEQADEANGFEFFPLLERYQTDTRYSTYCKKVDDSAKNYLFGEVYEH